LDLSHKFKQVSRTLSVIVIAVGAVVVLGWVFSLPLLKSVFPGFVEMKANTAIAFLLSGIALFQLHRKDLSNTQRWLTKISSLIVLSIGALTLFEYAFGVNLAIDEMFFHDAVTNPAFFPGRMAVPTAFCFFLIGSVLFLFTLSGMYRLSQSIAMIVGGFSLLALCGYFYNVASLYTLYTNNPMALHTAISFTLLSLGILFLVPDQGFMRIMIEPGAGSLMLRRLLPACIFVPALLGWLILAGQKVGRYDMTIGLALFAVLTIAIMSIITWWNARSIFLMDTDRQLAQKALELSNSQFKVLFDEALDVILVVDWRESTIVKVNGIVRRDLGYKPEYLIGKPFSVLLPPSNMYPQDQILDRLQSFGHVFASQEFLRVDGSLCPMDLTATIIPQNGDRAILVTLRDVTERKRLEAEIFQAEMMRIEMEKERELMKLKEDFITMVSHDFRTPLSVILSSNDILERYHERLTEQRRVEQLQRIREQVGFMTELLDDVLTLGKARADRLDFNPQAFDIEQVCRSLFEQIQSTASPKHSFIFRRTGKLDDATLDEKLLRRVLANLLTNAVKYSPNGGEIRFDVLRQDDQVVFKIQDHGIGIPERDQERLFEPFHRASNSRSISGTGLGLAIVYDTIRVHGGTIDMQSLEGEGTTFTVRLPYR
jgi:PAS domain S-box-containing protein